MYRIQLEVSKFFAPTLAPFPARASETAPSAEKLAPAVQPALLSPCTGVCELNPEGLCRGCFRTGDEIGRWSTMSASERTHIMDVVLLARETA
jgi:uncharacterized protein